MIWIFRGVLSLGLLIFLFVAFGTGVMLANLVMECISTSSVAGEITIAVLDSDGWQLSMVQAMALLSGVFVVAVALGVYMAWLIWTVKLGDR